MKKVADCYNLTNNYPLQQHLHKQIETLVIEDDQNILHTYIRECCGSA